MRLPSHARNAALQTAPRMAMPVTAPNSRLVFVADAASPDRSAGTAPSTDEVTGTTQVPMPTPANPSAAASGREAGVGLITTLVTSRPAANNRQPATNNQPPPTTRGPPPPPNHPHTPPHA